MFAVILRMSSYKPWPIKNQGRTDRLKIVEIMFTNDVEIMFTNDVEIMFINDVEIMFTNDG